jgi:hypothetical protein
MDDSPMAATADFWHRNHIRNHRREKTLAKVPVAQSNIGHASCAPGVCFATAAGRNDRSIYCRAKANLGRLSE